MKTDFLEGVLVFHYFNAFLVYINSRSDYSSQNRNNRTDVRSHWVISLFRQWEYHLITVKQTNLSLIHLQYSS